MADIAALGLSVDSKGVVTATTQLDQFATSSDKASVSAEKVGAASKRGSAGVDGISKAARQAASHVRMLEDAERAAALQSVAMGDSTQRAAATIASTGVSSKQAAFGMKNLAFQAQDLGVQFAMAASSSNPLKGVLMALVMQGPQIKDAMSQAGLGVGDLVKRFGPAALAIGVAVGALALFTNEVEKHSKANIGMGDVVLGTYDAIAAKVGSTATEMDAKLKKLGIDVGAVWEWIANAAKKSVNIMIGATAVIPKVIAATLDKIPQAFGDAFYSAANLAIEAVNWLIKKAASGVNSLVGTFNSVFGTDIKAVVVGGLDGIANPYKGAMSALGSAGAKAFTGAFKQDYLGDFAKFVAPYAAKRSIDDAKKGGKAAGKAAGKGFNDEFAKEFAKALENIEAGLLAIGIAALGGVGKAAGSFADGVGGAIEKGADEAARAAEEAARIADEDRQRALSAAYEIADVVGGSIGNLIGELADAIIPLLDITKGLGKALEAFGKGAKLGGAVGGVAGSKTGGALGGGLGQIAGDMIGKGLTAAGSSLGQFAGPLGAIAGGILGGVIGGLMKSTPRASATISVIAGKAMDTAITGSSGKLKAMAGEMANGVISGLTDLAASLGAELTGDAKVSIGQRKGNYRVDTSGSGATKTSKGAIDFGEDKAAAIAFALQDAIKDGVLGGLSASLQKLITGDGDLQAQLQKALNFKSVFDDLAKRDDPAKWAQDEITKWHNAMAKIFAEAGATADELAELERLTGIKRVEAAKETSAAAEQAIDDARRTRELEIEIMRLSGNDLGALTAERALEREGLSASVVEIMKRRDALLDEAAATALANAAAEEAKTASMTLTDQRRALNLEITAMIDPIASLKIAREDEYRAADKSLWPLIERKHLLQDEAAAAIKLNAIADERLGLENQWLQAIGDEAEIRKRALAGLDPSNRALQQQIWDYTDAKAREAEVMEQAVNRAKELADAHKAITDQFTSQIDALKQTSDKFHDFARSIAEFRNGVLGENNRELGYTQARTQFLSTSSMAQMGSENALGAFAADAQKFLDLAKNRAGSSTDYQREIALVAREAMKAEGGASGLASAADREIAMLQKQMDTQLAALEASAISINATQTEVVLPQLSASFDTSIAGLKAEIAQLRAERKADRSEEKAEAISMAGSLSDIATKFRRWDDGDGMRVSNFSDAPITVQGSVTIANPVASPVNVDQVP